MAGTGDRVVDDIAATGRVLGRILGAFGKAAEGDRSALDALGDEACEPQAADAVELCPQPRCSLAKGHEGACRTVRAVATR